MKKTYIAPKTEELGLLPNVCVCDGSGQTKSRSSKEDDDDDSGSLLW